MYLIPYLHTIQVSTPIPTMYFNFQFYAIKSVHVQVGSIISIANHVS